MKQLLLFLTSSILHAAPMQSFSPGAIWPNTNGVHINAHGGGMLFHEGTYYWCGEHKIAGGAGNVAQIGVGMYCSKDLYLWKNEGIALPVSEDPQSDIAKGCVIERPKVIFNKKTGKFVMWFHLELKDQGYNAARSGVAVADKVTGPYRYLGSFRPNAGVWPSNVPDDLKKPLSADDAALRQARGYSRWLQSGKTRAPSHHPLACVIGGTRLCLHMEWRKSNTVSSSGWVEAMEKVWRSPTAQHRIRLNLGDIGFGQEAIMAWHEQGKGKRPSYLFKLKLTANVKKAIAKVPWND